MSLFSLMDRFGKMEFRYDSLEEANNAVQNLSTLGYEGELAIVVVPELVGYAEAAEILGWDKRRIGTYMQRGTFPEPVQRLASGPIWTRQQIEEYRDNKAPTNR